MNIARNFDGLVSMALYFQNLREFFEYEPKITSGDKIPGEFESIEFKNVSFASFLIFSTFFIFFKKSQKLTAQSYFLSRKSGG